MEKRIPTLKKKFNDEIIPALKKEFNYTSVMQVPKLKKIVLNQGIGQGVADKKIITTAQEELSLIAGQRAIQRNAKKGQGNYSHQRIADMCAYGHCCCCRL